MKSPLWFNYDLSRAVRLMDAVGRRTRWWGVVVGDFGFGVMRRDRKLELQVSADGRASTQGGIVLAATLREYAERARARGRSAVQIKLDELLSLCATIEYLARYGEEADLPSIQERDRRIEWFTTCGKCADLLDASYAETARAERAEAEAADLKARCDAALESLLDASFRFHRSISAILSCVNAAIECLAYEEPSQARGPK